MSEKRRPIWSCSKLSAHRRHSRKWIRFSIFCRNRSGKKRPQAVEIFTATRLLVRYTRQRAVESCGVFFVFLIWGRFFFLFRQVAKRFSFFFFKVTLVKVQNHSSRFLRVCLTDCLTDCLLPWPIKNTKPPTTRFCFCEWHNKNSRQVPQQHPPQ